MPYVVRLPPLRTRSDTALDDLNQERSDRRKSVLASSDAQEDSKPIHYILVYRDHDEKSDDHKPATFRADRRKEFEDSLKDDHHLILQHTTKNHYTYVKIHTPFEVLLKTAETMRMKLPIEKIDQNANEPSVRNQTWWYRFMKRCQKPFRLDAVLDKDDPDFYTAIYTSKNPKFAVLFDTLRGNREAYFTASERSLLTHQLLTRAHTGNVHDDEDEKRQEPVVITPGINAMVEAHRTSSGRAGIHRLISKKVYTHYYPLHEPSLEDGTGPDGKLNDRQKLQTHWATMRLCLKFQPLSLVRSYMGEKVAFYFAFYGFYNQMLVPAAVVGLIVFIYGAASVASDGPTSDICGNFGQSTIMCPRCDKSCAFWKLSDSCVYSKMSFVFDNVGTLVFAIFMSLWTRWFVEFWKRRQAVLQYEWDSMDFEEQLEPIRKQYEDEATVKRINPVTGIDEPYIATSKRIPFFLIAALVVLLAMGIVCATVFGTIVYRVQMDYILKDTAAKNLSPIIITVTSAVMNLICSLLLTQFYYWVSRKLTDLELYKYPSNYDDSLTVKIYLFQFVSFYSSLFYIAFFKGRFNGYPSTIGVKGSGDFTEQCDPAGCLVELSIQLIIIMIGRQLIGLTIQFVTATSRSCLCCKSGKKEKRDQWEIDKDLFDFNSDTLSSEYLELVIQFGFVTLFVVAFPLAPLFALINNLIGIRLDAWKFLSKYKRPIPYKASDIGIWSDILSAVSYFAVLTNAIVIAWTSEFIPKMVYRSVQSTGTSLDNYVNWTLSSFSIQDYNNTGTMPPTPPDGFTYFNFTYCRYRDFRSSTSPYDEMITYWNVLAARLSFIIVFEHIVFFTIYILQWLVPDVPKKIKDKIEHEHYIDQRERWADRSTAEQFGTIVTVSGAINKLRTRKETAELSAEANGDISPPKQRKRPRSTGVRISPEDEQD